MGVPPYQGKELQKGGCLRYSINFVLLDSHLPNEMSINTSGNFLPTEKASSEKIKFKKFYRYGSVLWLLLIIVVSVGKKVLAEFDSESINIKFSEGVLNLFVMVGIFGIPIIFLLSLFIRLAEYFVNKIPVKENRDGKSY